MSTKVCPRCGGNKIKEQMGKEEIEFECEECGLVGTLFPEIDENDYKRENIN